MPAHDDYSLPNLNVSIEITYPCHLPYSGTAPGLGIQGQRRARQSSHSISFKHSIANGDAFASRNICIKAPLGGWPKLECTRRTHAIISHFSFESTPACSPAGFSSPGPSKKTVHPFQAFDHQHERLVQRSHLKRYVSEPSAISWITTVNQSLLRVAQSGAPAIRQGEKYI